MSKSTVEIVVIADRSGSMSRIQDDAIGGYNAFLAEQQAMKGKANLTLALFDDQYEVAVDAVPVKDVKPLDNSTFVPRGTTALHDAIGRALSDLHAKNPKKAIVCILTDGRENASREFTQGKVKDLIEQSEDKGWRVVYLAANQDAFAVGTQMGMRGDSTVNFQATGAGILGAYTETSAIVGSYREQ